MTRATNGERNWRRTAVMVALAASGLAGVVGLLHTRMARPLMMRLGGCPVGRASPEDLERARMAAVRATRGQGTSPDRPALGFDLDATTQAEVEAWAEQARLTCESKRSGSLFQCTGVPAVALGLGANDAVVDDVCFGFRPSDHRLVNVTTMRYDLPAADASREFGAVEARLERRLGAPTTSAGHASPEGLGARAFATAYVAYAYGDYVAELTASNMPGRGVAVREHYMSARD